MTTLLTDSPASLAGAALVLALLAPLGAAEKVPEASSPAAVKPGQTALVRPDKGMSYFLRLPASYQPKRGARLILFLHGSSMNGLEYLRSFEAKRWCTDDILVCPNGEQGADPHGQCNFTFESAPLVAGVTREVTGAFKARQVYIGGHSQGGFVTYSAILLFPDLYHGAFPMAGDCWIQNEPNLWQDRPAILEKQRKIAIAVIHGKQDPVVRFAQGKHAHDIFVVMGYPRVRLFAPERLGHQFMLSPVPEALEWLDGMVGDDAARRVAVAEASARDKEWGWAVEAAKDVADLKNAPAAAKKRAALVLKAAEAAAPREVKAMMVAMAKEPAEKWLPRWYEFRRLHGNTQTARTLVERFEKDRADQRAAGARLHQEARASFQRGAKEEGREVLRRLLKEAPAAYEAYYAVEWLKEG
ncbi:MAG TPA: hypothetical protein VMT52_12630 [Planctomycetota bacterium]|nr:hypothetical protein [Planctomycetota bacterium]